jgi:hypothetical protein
VGKGEKEKKEELWTKKPKQKEKGAQPGYGLGKALASCHTAPHGPSHARPRH